MGKGALAMGPKLPRPPSTLPLRTCCPSATTANKRPYPSAATDRIIDGNPHRGSTPPILLGIWGRPCGEFSFRGALGLQLRHCLLRRLALIANPPTRRPPIAGSTRRQERRSQTRHLCLPGHDKTLPIPITPLLQR